MYFFNDGHNRSLKTYREQTIQGISETIREKIELGYKPHFINLMFHHIPYGREIRVGMMINQVDRVHTILTHHMVRSPDSAQWRHLRPVFIGAPDLPVWKHGKVTGRSLNLNGGLHFNLISLTVPSARTDMRIEFQNLLFGKRSRLTVPLETHFQRRSRFYVNDVLSRIHVEPVETGTMADYALKTFKKGRVSGDSIHILS